MKLKKNKKRLKPLLDLLEQQIEDEIKEKKLKPLFIGAAIRGLNLLEQQNEDEIKEQN